MTNEQTCQGGCPCDSSCPLMHALNLIGGKWKIPIICALHSSGTIRYNELKRKISGITNTMLASSLKDLEDAGLVTRMQYMEIPPRVEYSLTDKCSELLPSLMLLASWAKKC